MAKLPLSHSHSTKKPILYTACGDAEKLTKFKETAQRFGVDVVDKWQLIDESDRKLLEDLRFDQLGILDYVVLRHSQVFWGVGGSTFSHSLALWRHLYQFGNLYYYGNDFQQKLLGPKWVQRNLYDIMW